MPKRAAKTKAAAEKAAPPGAKAHREPPFALKVKRSPAGGLGLFAAEAIPKGRFVVEYWGPLADDRKACRVGGKYLFEVAEDLNILGGDRRNLARYANHSCEPNAEARAAGRRIFIFSLRRIEAGEEISYSYGPDYFRRIIRPLGCRCPKCRRRAERAGNRR